MNEELWMRGQQTCPRTSAYKDATGTHPTHDVTDVMSEG